MSIGKKTRKPVAAANAMPRTIGKAKSDMRPLSQPSTACYSQMLTQVGAQDHAASFNNDIGPDELTTTWFKLLGAAIAIISMTIGAAPAELTSDQPAADWMQGYGERNKDCLEWTDTCVNCVRAQSGENFSCSNIGIACQPKDVTCVRRAEEKAK